MLNADVVHNILQYCCLETSVAFGDACQSSSITLTALDGSLMKKLVQSRVPWFTLNEEFSSWRKCARVVIARSNNKRFTRCDAVKGPPHHPNELPIEPVKCFDIARDDTMRKDMKPLFPTAKLQNPLTRKAVVCGTTLQVENQNLDLKTMILSGSPEPQGDVKPVEEVKPLAISPSGLKVRHKDGIPIRVVDENDTFLQIQFFTALERLVHKATQPRDNDGTLVFDKDPFAPVVNTSYKGGDGAINLIPGSGGALIRIYNSELLYVYPERPSERKMEQLMWLPEPCLGDFHPGQLKFWVTWDGFLYFFYRGIITQLWIDLEDSVKWDFEFPFIGPLHCYPPGKTYEKQDTPEEWCLVQQGRFITNTQVGGYVVGDLQTGALYYAARALSDEFIPCIPFETDDQEVGFYTMDKEVTQYLFRALDDLYDDMDSDVDLTKSFENKCADMRRKWDEDKEVYTGSQAVDECWKLMGYKLPVLRRLPGTYP